MSSEQDRVSNILLVAITRMGDLLQASPTIVGLKRQNPHARITVLVDEQFTTICEGIPGIDEIYEIDLSLVCRCIHREEDGIVDAYQYVSKFVDDLRERKFDYVLNMSNAGYTAMLLKMLDIPESRGWIADDEGYRLISNPWAMLFAAYVFHSNRDYNSLNLVDIFRCSAGVDDHPQRLMYEVPDKFKNFPDEFLSQIGLNGDGPLICLQAGASQAKRQWSPHYFAKLAQYLVEDLNARVVLTGSPTELPIVEAVMSHYDHPRVQSAVGRTNLGQLGALLERADVLITGDTGPMHVAVAVGTPVVAMFLASALAYETGPYSAGNIVVQPQIACSPCNPNFPCSRPDCHDQISPELMAYLTKLRLEVPIGEEASVEIPIEKANPASVTVYYSTFDEDGFLDFKPMNGLRGRRGYTWGYFDAARDAYRNLWKEELGAVQPRVIPESRDKTKLPIVDNRNEVSGGLNDTIRLATEGVSQLEQLVGLVKDVNSPPHRLGEVSRELEKIDRDIEDIGLANPVFGAMVRMFIMEKQNMRGEDPLVLASEMQELYETLLARSEKFGKWFSYFSANEQMTEVL